MYLWIAMCMRAHLAHVAFEISGHSPNFLDTPLMFIIFINNHLQTNNTQNKMRAVPRLCELYPGICLTTEEKARKNLSQGSQRMPVGTMKTRYTEENISW
jgi:hypothetical protein